MASSATDDIVSGIMSRWAAAFSTLDAKVLSSLYSKNAFFFGSNPNLYRGNDGVQAYFAGLPRWSAPSVQFTDVKTAQAASDLINVAGTASFIVEEGAEPLLPFPWSFTVVLLICGCPSGVAVTDPAGCELPVVLL